MRYYDSLPDESERCREYATKILASLMSLGLVDTADLPERMTKVHQGTDECGLYVLASLEREAAEAMGHGPAATGWPTWAASRWHERIHKASTNLKLEQIKRIAELQKHHETWFSSASVVHNFLKY